MELRLLGRVEARHSGAAVDLGPRQQRFILAVLGLELKRTVPLDRLIALIWGEDPPRTARNSVQVAVSRLRSVLPDDVALVNTGSGYRLDLEPEQCDAGRFDALLGQARSAPDSQAYELLQQAEALWRGPACGGVTDEETRLRLTHGLHESRLVATEDRMEIALRLGRAGEVLGELTAAVEQHPTRERLVAALMSGLHRTGQTAEALALAARTRELLADELGIDPGRHLQEVQQAILRGELEDSPVAAVPAELPAGVAGFIGRVGALQQLDALLAERIDELPLIAIVGPGGAGKTGLAVQWAHRVAERYTDGQLYADLRGHSTSPTLAPGEVVGRFLRALGVDGSAIPADPAEAAALFRSRTAGRRLLIVLDNAADAGQIRPLLPGSPSCLVVCTSRDRLTGLVGQDGARRLILGRLSRPESLTLLQNVIGGDPDREDLDLLAERCADLPLALRIAGAILAAAPELAVSDYLEELSGPEALDALEADDTFAVRATFELSYQRLDPAQQRLFRLLGIHPGPDFDAAAAAVIADRPLRETRRLLRRLGAAHLVREESHGRYTFHDLLGLYSAELAQADPEAAAARRRLFAWYLAMTAAATALLMPGRMSLPELVDPPPETFPDRSAAREFLAVEQPALVAVIRVAAQAGDPACWQLISVLRLYLRFQSRTGALSEVAVLSRSAPDEPATGRRRRSPRPPWRISRKASPTSIPPRST
ncbi:MAG TPA: BTAD domain-containing putative transcriptional regulator [Mycobacteriales bacterium]|nr:BTAD domain-containing putative transcriptional regulator [Mycobacteriales bacterium]